LYPNAIVPVGSYQERVLKAMGVPFYVDGRITLPPQFSWGSRIGLAAQGVSAPPNTLYNGFLCWQRTNDVALSLTKLWRSHTIKAGYQSQDSLKQQNVGTQTAGVLPPEGSVNFGQDSNNPLDTGFGFANAAIGVFTDFKQQNALRSSVSASFRAPCPSGLITQISRLPAPPGLVVYATHVPSGEIRPHDAS